MFRSLSEINSDRDVMITGIGMVTPLAIGREQTWTQLICGASVCRDLTKRDIDHFDQLTDLLKRVPRGATVDHQAVAEFVADSWLFERRVEQQAFFSTFGCDCLNNLVAASLVDAMTDAGLNVPDVAGPRTGCVIGSSKASLRSMELEHVGLRGTLHQNDSRPGNLWHNGFMPDAPLLAVRQLTNASGPSSCPVAACATGLISVIEAAQLINSDLCDVCIAGSADASLRASVLAAFHRLGVTSRHRNTASACRPFDVSRDGFIIGEGAAIIILESRAHAERRRAECYAKLTSGHWLTDSTGMTQVQSDGGVVAELLKRMNITSPDIVSFHGTATETNDQAEAQGLASVFGTSPTGFGVKGAIGHLLGAAGSVELGLALLALHHRTVPGTANFNHTDLSCPANVANSRRSLSNAKTALKLSLGFGGHVVGCSMQRS